MKNEIQNNTSLAGVGAAVFNDEVYLIYKTQVDKIPTLMLAKSKNGLAFTRLNKTLNIQDLTTREIKNLSGLHLSKKDKIYYLTLPTDQGLGLFATGELIHYGKLTVIPDVSAPGMLIPDYKVRARGHALIFGSDVLRIAYSKDLLKWEVDEIPLLTPNYTSWEQAIAVKLSVAEVINTPQGIVLVYFLHVTSQNSTDYSLQAVLLDKTDPKKLLWQSEVIWDNTEDWAQNKVVPVGAVFFRNRLLSYWNHDGKNILTIQHKALSKIIDSDKDRSTLFLRRIENNPVIAPSKESWENRATFNPGAIVEDEKVHLVYRAIGDEDTSVIGYGRSLDGVSLAYRSSSPSFVPKNFVKLDKVKLSSFVSGGGYGGCEDPRITRIDDRIYMTYVAFDGASAPRVALTSIAEEDFFANDWKWTEPVMISRPGVVNKNAVIFPEKVRGKYVIMHRVFPNILIDYLDDLNFDRTKFLRGDAVIKPRPLFWDSRKIGAGPPPIKTDKGWLLIYHGVGDQDAGRYKVGAMLLETENPEKVIARSYLPILTPEHPLENEGHKAGVVYPCGAVIRKKELIVYYGGADTVTLAAKANSDDFVADLMSQKMPRLRKVMIN